MQRKKGSLLLVLVFAALMAVVVLGMMRISSTLYSTARSSAQMYSDIQSYRAMSEMACYKYVTDLRATVVWRDFGYDWISMADAVIYNQAVEEIVMAMGSAEDQYTWKVKDIRTVLEAAPTLDPAVITFLLGKIEGVRHSFKLEIPDGLQIDWDNERNAIDTPYSILALEPVRVVVTLEVKGEVIYERYDVHGLWLLSSDVGDRGVVMELKFIDYGEEVKITRVPEEVVDVDAVDGTAEPDTP